MDDLENVFEKMKAAKEIVDDVSKDYFGFENFQRLQCACGYIGDALTLLRKQQPRVMTLEEVTEHYSLPPVFPDSLDLQEDYLQDIAPLYFDFPQDDPWAVHWHQQVWKYLEYWKASYGEKWRCWTSKPTNEQRSAVPWPDCPNCASAKPPSCAAIWRKGPGAPGRW